jgi:hypothetical protein
MKGKYPEPAGPSWRPPLYSPKGHYVWFDGTTIMSQQAMVVWHGGKTIDVYRVGADGGIELLRWTREKATDSYWLGRASVRKLKGAALVLEARAITGAASQNRREARKKREAAENLSHLVHHLLVAIRRSTL